MSRLQSYHNHRRALGLEALRSSPKLAGKRLMVHSKIASYWMKKVGDPSFHHHEWGGSRRSNLLPAERASFHAALWLLLEQDNSVSPMIVSN